MPSDHRWLPSNRQGLPSSTAVYSSTAVGFPSTDVVICPNQGGVLAPVEHGCVGGQRRLSTTPEGLTLLDSPDNAL
jgi:hypothetical protein